MKALDESFIDSFKQAFRFIKVVKRMHNKGYVTINKDSKFYLENGLDEDEYEYDTSMYYLDNLMCALESETVYCTNMEIDDVFRNRKYHRVFNNYKNIFQINKNFDLGFDFDDPEDIPAGYYGLIFVINNEITRQFKTLNHDITQLRSKLDTYSSSIALEIDCWDEFSFYPAFGIYKGSIALAVCQYTPPELILEVIEGILDYMKGRIDENGES